MEERFVEAPGNVDWGPIDLTFSRFGSAGLPSNAGIEGSWVGAVTTENGGGDAPEFWAQFDNVSYLTTAERLGQRTLKIVENVSGIPSGKTLYLKTASTGTEAHPAMRGVPSPIIRAEWVTTWADYTITVGGGPEWAPPLTLDASWWLTPADAQRVADALAAEVTTSMPTMSSVSVLWDPRRQIGDIEEWIARDAEGDEAWRARVLVTGYSESWDGNVPEQSVDVRVISWTDPIGGKTYADLAGVYDSYSDLSGTYQETYDALPGGTP